MNCNTFICANTGAVLRIQTVGEQLRANHHLLQVEDLLIHVSKPDGEDSLCPAPPLNFGALHLKRAVDLPHFRQVRGEASDAPQRCQRDAHEALPMTFARKKVIVHH